MPMYPPIIRFIFNPDDNNSKILQVAEAAEKYGFTMFAFNGDVFPTTLVKTLKVEGNDFLKHKLFHMKDVMI